ncbi:Iron-sulfur cluster carrier protein [Acaryochloris thomasi RCC1774]|uniref:Iron-sulfur cluster carrier protein n=1 Tax=Acaryochloris thomasi RCC1774 TaxID=1764569 RepID=A0A2W1JHR1_9CYAN|nr:ParA family protein [Acaryochloris thomasi]PZD70662.1 Iron-sulfur cluster carrier protein [Acaryochloris thomasi RCC1774]
MPTTIAIVSRKGGVGKSTLCSNLAVAARTSTIIDCDDQASLADWGDRRTSKNPSVISVPAKRATATLKKINTRWNFIDTPGTLDANVIEVMQASDFVLVVLRYGQFELDSISTTLSAVKLINRPAAIALNLLHPNTNAKALIESIEEAQLGFPICPVAICNRANFQAAAIEGLGVTEESKDTAAAQEVSGLWSWMKKEIKNASSS